MSNVQGIGHPKTGYRVHWFWWYWYKSAYLRQHYLIDCCRDSDSYMLLCRQKRYNKAMLGQLVVMLVTRTSRKCYRLIAYDNYTGACEYKSFKLAKDCAKYIERLARQWARKREVMDLDYFEPLAND